MLEVCRDVHSVCNKFFHNRLPNELAAVWITQGGELLRQKRHKLSGHWDVDQFMALRVQHTGI